MKQQTKALLILTLLIVLGVWWSLDRSNQELTGPKEQTQVTPVPQVLSPPTPSQVAATPVVFEKSECERKLDAIELSHPLTNLRLQKATERRMRNLHLQFEGEIYRLRQFYDDADEGERLTYLVYEEDEDEFATIIERTLYQKGPKYQELQQHFQEGRAQKLFEEEAYSLDGLYLHYRGDKLIHAAGLVGGSHLECTL